MSTRRERIESILRGAGLSDKPWAYDSSLHSWRCEHPDRYGECDCFERLLDELEEATAPPLPGWVERIPDGLNL